MQNSDVSSPETKEKLNAEEENLMLSVRAPRIPSDDDTDITAHHVGFDEASQIAAYMSLHYKNIPLEERQERNRKLAKKLDQIAKANKEIRSNEKKKLSWLHVIVYILIIGIPYGFIIFSKQMGS